MKCPIIKKRLGMYGTVIFETVAGQGRVYGTGYLHLERRKDGHYYVSKTATSKIRRGVGTCLYTEAAKFVCGKGRQLFSDTIRTEASDGFWQKQHAKGRAECTKCMTWADQATWRSYDERGFTYQKCRSNCKQYVLKPCETMLGRPGRRKR